MRRTPTAFYDAQDFGASTPNAIYCQGTGRSVACRQQPQPKPDLQPLYHVFVSGTVTIKRREDASSAS